MDGLVPLTILLAVLVISIYLIAKGVGFLVNYFTKPPE